MEKKLIETGKGKYGILGTFEVGNSGHFEQRVLISGLSKTKAIKLMNNLK